MQLKKNPVPTPPAGTAKVESEKNLETNKKLSKEVNGAASTEPVTEVKPHF